MLSCSIRFSEPSFWMGGGLESHCMGRVCGADGAVRIRTAPQLWGEIGYRQPDDSDVSDTYCHHQTCTVSGRIKRLD